jgi:N-methylhydantoinase B
LISDTWGGGGCGDPLERDPELVKFDVDAGLVSPAGARRYGVVLDAAGVVDRDETARLRASLAAERGPVKLFDRGFDSIEELKSRCLAETGLPPPTQPTFAPWVRKLAAGRAGAGGNAAVKRKSAVGGKAA